MIAALLGRRDVALVFGAALLVRLVAVAFMQPRLGRDAVGYLSSARDLVDSWPSALASLPITHSPLYPVLLVPVVILPNATWLAAIAQAFVGAGTALVLMRLTARETGSRASGLAAGLIAAVQPTFVFWTSYLVSETAFLFLVTLTADQTLLAARSRRPLLASVSVGLLALLCIGARPTGAPFALAVLLTLAGIAWGKPERMWRLVLGYAAPFLLLLVGFGALSAVLSQTALPQAAAGRVADWAGSAVRNGLIETEAGRGTSGVDLDVTPPPIVETLPPQQRTEFLDEGPTTFVTHHPEFLLQQTARKLRMFWSPVLPEYSVFHALGAVLYFAGLYLFAAVGAVQAQRYKGLAILCSSSVVLFTLTSVVTIVDYDQRYRLPVELFLIPLAAIGLNRVLELLPRVGIHVPGQAGRRSPEPMVR